MDTSNSIPTADGTFNWSDAMKWVAGFMVMEVVPLSAV